MTDDNSIQALKQAWVTERSLETEVALIATMARQGEIDNLRLIAACACEYKPALLASQQLDRDVKVDTSHNFSHLDELEALDELWECHALIQLALHLPMERSAEDVKRLLMLSQHGRQAAKHPIPKNIKRFQHTLDTSARDLTPFDSALLRRVKRILIGKPDERHEDAGRSFYCWYVQWLTGTDIMANRISYLYRIDPRPLMQAREAYFAALHSIMPAVLGYGQLPELAIRKSL